MTPRRRKTVPIVLTAAAALLTGLLPGQASAGGPERTPERPGPHPVVLRALQRDLRLDEAAVVKRLADEAVAARIEAALVPALGADYAGSWFDAALGRLVVGVTDPARAEQVRRHGAVPRTMQHSYARLTAIKARLDGIARRAPEAVAGVSSWRVDPVANRVVVTRTAGRPAGALAVAAAETDAVRWETTTHEVTATTDFLDGGEGIRSGGATCSVGFNARLTYSDLPGVSDPVIISAGHCVGASLDVQGFGNSTTVSRTLGRWWLRDYDRDWAVAGSLDTSWWVQGPWISLHTPNDDWTTVWGTQQRPIGSSICKSGFTTHVTCGVIRARNESVFLSDLNRTVYGLSRDTTCQEKGDSGGPHYTGDIQAQGVSSAAVLTVGKRCLATIGQENRSWYVEITYIQAYTGARVLTG